MSPHELATLEVDLRKACVWLDDTPAEDLTDGQAGALEGLRRWAGKLIHRIEVAVEDLEEKS